MKKLTIIIFVILMLLMLSGCNDYSDITDQVANVAQMENENVLGVKNGTNSNYPSITYGEAFENFFSYPTWKYFEGIQEGEDTDGDGVLDTESRNVEVVEFTGYCMYQDVEVKALIQFVLDNNAGTFEASYLSFNEVPQNKLILLARIEKAFESSISTSTDSTEAVLQHETEYLEPTSTEIEATEEVTVPAIEEPDPTTPPIDSSANTTEELPKKELVGTFTQVGVYDHDEYSYLDLEYIPTIYLYSDGTFEFHCNFYEFIAEYEGWWVLTEEEGLNEFYFAIENEPSLPNLDFYIFHNTARCDADFYSDYDDGMTFGMTTSYDVLFHIEFGSSSTSSQQDMIVEQYCGAWQDIMNPNCSMTIEYYDGEFDVVITWEDSSSVADVWNFIGIYNPSTSAIEYQDCTRLTVECIDDQLSESVHYFDGSGRICLEDDGYIYWEDHLEDMGVNCAFKKE